MNTSDTFKAMIVSEADGGVFQRRIGERNVDELPAGGFEIEVNKTARLLIVRAGVEVLKTFRIAVGRGGRGDTQPNLNHHKRPIDIDAIQLESGN